MPCPGAAKTGPRMSGGRHRLISVYSMRLIRRAGLMSRNSHVRKATVPSNKGEVFSRSEVTQWCTKHLLQTTRLRSLVVAFSEEVAADPEKRDPSDHAAHSSQRSAREKPEH